MDSLSKQKKIMYKVLAWFFTTVIATGALTGCDPSESSTKYGPPPVINSSTSSGQLK